jgi:protocatechuate 3,4-dioxygenase beta subunit
MRRDAEGAADRTGGPWRAVGALSLAAALACAPAAPGAEGEPALPDCEWCGAAEAPAELTSTAVLAGPDEPGERLVVEGVIYEADGRTPAEGVLLYAYNTNAEGVYQPGPDPTGNERRHGRLRGWLRTGSDGRYRIETVRPAAYPGSTIPAHVHMTVQPPGGEEDWIDSIHFADDPLLTERQRRRLRGKGGSGIVQPTQDENGVQRAERDVVLP